MTQTGSNYDVGSKAGSGLPGAPAKRDIRALTGIRFFAAAWVVVFHFRGDVESVFPAWRHLEAVTGAGYLGVDLFFILSGFIIAYNYASTFDRGVLRRDYLRFLWLRLARIYPVHLATLLTLLSVVFAARVLHVQLKNPFGASDFLKNLFMVHAWFGRADPSWNYPAWSISAEWFAYLLFPLAARLFHRARSARASVLGASCSLAVLFIGMVAFNNYNPLLRVVTEFAAGMFLARLFAMTSPSAAWEWTAGLALGAIPLVLLLAHGDAQGVLLIVVFAVTILSLAHSRHGVARALSTKWIVFLGEVSYALYMTHAVIQMVLGNLLPMAARAGSPLIDRVAIVLLYAVVLLAVAVGTHLLLERPARDRLRRVGPASSTREPAVSQHPIASQRSAHGQGAGLPSQRVSASSGSAD